MRCCLKVPADRNRSSYGMMICQMLIFMNFISKDAPPPQGTIADPVVADDATLVDQREAGAAERGQCSRTRSHAGPVSRLLPLENHSALGAGRHETLQAGHPTTGHHLHRSPQIRSGRRQSVHHLTVAIPSAVHGESQFRYFFKENEAVRNGTKKIWSIYCHYRQFHCHIAINRN